MATSWGCEEQGSVWGQEELLYGRILPEEEEKEEEGFSAIRTATEVNVQERAPNSKD